VAPSAGRGMWARPKDDVVAPWEWRSRKNREFFTDYSDETVAELRGCHREEVLTAVTAAAMRADRPSSCIRLNAIAAHSGCNAATLTD
jgi:hypothetical protein